MYYWLKRWKKKAASSPSTCFFLMEYQLFVSVLCSIKLWSTSVQEPVLEGCEMKRCWQRALRPAKCYEGWERRLQSNQSEIMKNSNTTFHLLHASNLPGCCNPHLSFRWTYNLDITSVGTRHWGALHMIPGCKCCNMYWKQMDFCIEKD